MIRSFRGIQTIGSTTQPVFGTTLTAASPAPAVDRFTNTNQPGTSTPPIILTVSSTIGFIVNDRVQVGARTYFRTLTSATAAANRSLLDHGVVASIIDGTHMTVQGLLQNHANGEFVVLDEPASFVQVLPVSLSAAAYLGTDETVASGDGYTFDVIAPATSATAEPTYWHISPATGRADSYQTSQYWIAGAQNDTFIARFHQN